MDNNLCDQSDCYDFLFDEHNHHCEYEIDEEDIEQSQAIIDYSVLVLDQNTLQRELTNTMLISAKDKPHILSKRIANFVSLYNYLESFNHQQPKTFSHPIKPFISLRRLIDDSSDKPVAEVLYDLDNFESQDHNAFVNLFSSHRPGTMFKSFVSTGKENFTSDDDYDTIISFSLHQRHLTQSFRVNKTDNLHALGLAHIPTDNSDISVTFILDNYFEMIDQLHINDQVMIVPHRPMIIDKAQLASIVKKDEKYITLQLGTNDNIVLDITSKKSIITAPFTLTHTDGTGFSKYMYFKQPCLVYISDINLLPFLYPTLDEWLFVHPEITRDIFSINDIYTKFKGLEQTDVSFVNKFIYDNIKREVLAHHSRKPLKFVRRLYREKDFDTLLAIKDFPYKKTSIDSAYARMSYLSIGRRLYQQLLQCVQSDIENIQQEELAKKDVENELATVLAAVEAGIKHKKLQVFTSLEKAYNTPCNEGDQPACVWNEKNGTFIMLKVLTQDGVSMWSCDFPATLRYVSGIKNAFYFVETCRVGTVSHAAFLYNKSVNEAIDNINKQQTNNKLLKLALEQSKILLDHTYLKPIELNHVEAFKMLEGDPDYFDFEAMLENKEFGVNYTRLNNDSDDDDDPDINIEIQDSENDNDTTQLQSLVERFAKLIGISLVESQVVFITSHCNIATKYNTAVSTLKKAKVDMDTRLSQAASQLSFEKYQVLKANYNDKFNAKYESVMKPIHIKLLYHLTALLIIIIQSSLPNVIITPIQQLAKMFSIDGFPLDDKLDKGLIDYISNVLLQSEIQEFKFLHEPAYDLQKCKTLVHDNINNILNDAQNALLVEKLDVARTKYSEFKALLKKEKATLQEYAIWSTFRPYKNLNNVQIDANNIIGLTTKYINAIQHKTNNATALKLGIDKKPIAINSCCIQSLSSNYWSFYEHDADIQNYHNKLLRFGQAHDKVKLTAMIIKEPGFSPKLVLDTTYNVNKPLVEKSDINVLNTNESCIYSTIDTFVKHNALFHTSYLNDLLQRINTDDAWNELSEKAHNILLKLQSYNANSIITKYIEFLLSPTDDKLFVTILFNFIAYNLRSIFGKLASNYKLHTKWAKGREFSKDIKNSIYNAIQNSIPGDLLSKFANLSVDALQEKLRFVCLHGLQKVESFVNIINVVNNKRLSFLLTYILATVLENLYNIDENVEHNKNLTNYLVEMIIEKFIKKLNDAVAIREAAETFEKQREDGKQSIIKMMELMTKTERDMIDEMKKRGLVNLQELAKNKVVVNDNTKEQTDNQEGEAEQEIVNDIMNNQGENADDDFDD
jgi:hypothetical protein